MIVIFCSLQIEYMKYMHVHVTHSTLILCLYLLHVRHSVIFNPITFQVFPPPPPSLPFKKILHTHLYIDSIS